MKHQTQRTLAISILSIVVALVVIEHQLAAAIDLDVKDISTSPVHSRADDSLRCGTSKWTMPHPERSAGGKKKHPRPDLPDARPGEFPYYARMEIPGRKDRGACGTTILSDRILLTALNCVVDCDNPIHPKELRVTIGATTLESDLDSSGNQVNVSVFYKSRDVCAENRNAREVMMDEIALLVLKEELEFELSDVGHKSVNRVCFDNNRLLLESRKKAKQPALYSIGWRKQCGDLEKPKLQVRRLYQLNFKECISKQSNERESILASSPICVGTRKRKSEPYGEMGAPLLGFHEKEGSYYLEGISSGDPNACKAIVGSRSRNGPGLYVSIQRYFGWIQSIMRRVHDSKDPNLRLPDARPGEFPYFEDIAGRTGREAC